MNNEQECNTFINNINKGQLKSQSENCQDIGASHYQADELDDPFLEENIYEEINYEQIRRSKYESELKDKLKEEKDYIEKMITMLNDEKKTFKRQIKDQERKFKSLEHFNKDLALQLRQIRNECNMYKDEVIKMADTNKNLELINKLLHTNNSKLMTMAILKIKFEEKEKVFMDEMKSLKEKIEKHHDNLVTDNMYAIAGASCRKQDEYQHVVDTPQGDEIENAPLP